ncbi:conserved hypothetical protein [Culex quinquefasciatus]|uniref:Uncharacterized protein n=1 Tax=Culex quinquefasciatus TaxID=7176 RepID=B0W5V7_CULQU|nr:conserved hypothetical protein [Culex quinquefasciatus]|eukprot:XP_001844091.1 conserved hypothetical protein [Culex quinquefasciatus]
MWHLVKLFSNPHETGLRQRCTKLAQAIGTWQPALREALMARRKQLDQAIEGLGVHGLTADHTGALICLHVALKNELQRHIETYKAAIHKLEELSTVTVNPDPAQSSHQRLLAISHGDIQQRLIDNKTLLTMLDKPALKQLGLLIENLSNRVQNDKEALFCVGQIRRIDTSANTEERPAAGLLMNYSRGCDAVLGLMGPLSTPSSPTSTGGGGGGGGCSSGSDGYHSDSDSDETNKNRIDTLDSLNSLPQLKHAHQLKAKILFSIIVATMASPASQVSSLSASFSYVQSEISSALTLIQTAMASNGLTSSSVSSLTQLQTALSILQSTLNKSAINSLFSLPSSVTSGMSIAVTGVQTALNTANKQLSQVITAGTGASTTLINQLNSATTALNTAVASLQNQMSTLLIKLSFSRSLSGTMG